MLSLFSKKPEHTVRETSFAHFIKEASSAEKKRVYGKVLDKAMASQKSVLDAHRRAISACDNAHAL